MGPVCWMTLPIWSICMSKASLKLGSVVSELVCPVQLQGQLKCICVFVFLHLSICMFVTGQCMGWPVCGYQSSSKASSSASCITGRIEPRPARPPGWLRCQAKKLSARVRNAANYQILFHTIKSSLEILHKMKVRGQWMQRAAPCRPTMKFTAGQKIPK